MGVRPTFYVLVGIDDAHAGDERCTPVDRDFIEEIMYYRELREDELWTDGDLFSDLRDAERKMPGFTRYLADKLFVTSEGLPNIAGYVVYKGPHDDDIVRALAAIDEKYLEPGWARIPTLDKDEHRMMYRHYKYTDEDIACNRFVPGVFECMPAISRMNWQRAAHYLGLVGWNIPEDQLRYLLVWDWS